MDKTGMILGHIAENHRKRIAVCEIGDAVEGYCDAVYVLVFT